MSFSRSDPPATDEALFGVTRVLTFAGAKGLTSASGFFFERGSRLFESLGLNCAWYADVLMALTTGASHMHP